MKHLYEYSNDYQKIIDLIENCDEIQPEHLTMLGEVTQDSSAKVINVASYIKNLELLSQNMDNAINDIKKRKTVTDKKIESLKNYLKYNMEILDLKEVNSPHFDVKIRHNNYSLDIFDSSLLPIEYIKEKVDISIDKRKIIDDLKNDLLVPGASFIKTSTVQIK